MLGRGKAELLLPDATRCDLVTDTHAVEIDFADKWTEAIGQSLYYAFQTNKKPGIILIMEDKKDERHFLKVRSVIMNYNLPIEVFPLRVWEE